MALTIAVRNPAFAAAIQETMKRGPPYLGAFLNNKITDSEVITSVHPVNVSHRTKMFAVERSGDAALNCVGEECLTVVLKPCCT